MIRPLLTPRKITGNATIGLVSAARNSVRNIKRSTDTISNAPGVTKEQKFGMNYVGFFGSKKNSKILDKSLKTIRDSMVSTFGIATALKTAVKTGQGIFGFIGKIFKFAGSILNLLPFSGIIKTFLASIAVGGVGGLFFKFKDQILGFFERSEIASKIFDAIKSKAKGFTSYIKDIISDFLISRKMSGEFQQLRAISQQRLNEKISDLGGDQDAVVQANKDEIKLLEQELKLYKEQNKDLGLGDEYKNQVKAYQDRITELKTGAVPARQKLLPFAIPNLFPFNNFGLGDLQKVPAALNPVGALTENLTAERGVYTDRGYDKKLY